MHVQWAKVRRNPTKPKSEDTNQEKLYLLHMDLCGPMLVESVNGKKYILVIVDDYSRFTWVKCLRSKDEALDFIISLKKLKYHLASFDVVVKERTTANAITKVTYRNNSFSQQSVPSFDQLFEINELKAQSQEQDMVIKKLKERIKSLSGNLKEEKIKQELEEIETINIELDHRVTKLVTNNEHLKQTYKQLYDSIKSSRIRLKEQCDDLIKQVNIKSAENSDLNASLQEKVLVITALKDTLRKLKGKTVVDEAVTLHHIDPELLKINVAPLAPKLLNNRTVHYDYLKHTKKETATLREIVENERLLNPLNTSIYYASKIMGYGDYKIGNVTISRVYFMEGLGHNLFFVGQFCDSDLEVVFRQHTCFICNLEGVDLLTGSQGVDLLTGSQGNNLYTLSLGDMMASSPICLLSKASKTKSWLWHRHLSHLNFGAINHLARQGLVRGLHKLKFEKDHLCSACAKGKSKKKSHKPKSKDTNQEKLYLLHMDLYGPMRVKSVNGKKYIFVIVNDYSRFTWVKCLRSKDEAPYFIIKFLKLIQVRLKVPVRRIRTDNGTEFVNQTMREYYERVGISHEKLVAHSPQQDGVVERRNRTLIKAGRTISGPVLYEMTPAIISSGPVPKPTSSTPFVPPSRNEWDLLFQLLFDKLYAPTPSVDPPAPVIAPLAEVIPSKHAESTETQPPVLPNDVKEDNHDVEEDNHDIEVAYMGNDLLFGMPIPNVASDQSSSTISSHTIMHLDYQIPQHNRKWTKDHPLDNIIGQLTRPVSTRLQLHEQALFCYYDAFLTSVEPKTYKDALTQSCWIEAMQEELNEFERLEKYNFKSCDPMDTPMVEKSKLDEDKEGKAIDPSHYRGQSTSTLDITLSRSMLEMPFDELPFEEEILAFLRELGHSGEKKMITDVNINKLHQPSYITSKESTLQLVYDVLRLTPFYKAFLVTADIPEIYMQEFWATAIVHHHSIRFKMKNKKPVINKCLSGKSTGYDSLRLSQVQILWGMYHKKNVDFAYLMWDDFVYQVEHKDTKKSNRIYYPRFTKVIIHFFMTKDPPIPRRNKFDAILPIELTNEDIKNSAAYKEYYAIASGAAPPKTKATKGKQPTKSSKAKGLFVLSVVAMTEAEQMKLATKRSMQQTHISQATGSGADEGIGIIPGVPDVLTDESDEEISWKLCDEDDDDVDDQSDVAADDDDDQEDEEAQDDVDQDDNDDDQDTDNDSNDDASLSMNIGGEEGHDAEDDDEVLYRYVNINLEGRDSSLVSSQFVTSMLNPSPDAGIDSLFESTPWVDIQASTTVAPLTLTTSTLPPHTIPTISQLPQVATPPTTAQSTFLQDLLNFGSLFGFDHRLKTLEANFFKFVQTNQFAGVVSSIPGIVERYMDQRMNEAVKIIKEQVKVRISKILPKIKKTVNEQLEAKVLTRSSNSSKTSYVVAADLSELELKKILIEKMESNKSIHQLDQQRNLYKALVDAYGCDKIILYTYGDSVTFKRHRDDADKDEEPSARSDRGSKRRRGGKKPESTSSLKEKVTTGKSTEGDLAKQADSRSSFNELMDTLVDFSAFLINRLKVDTLTPELLDSLTYELMKRSCKSLVELEIFLEEVYKATTDQLDWKNPEGQQYPHNMLKPLPLIPNPEVVTLSFLITSSTTTSSIYVAVPPV
nr:retrovirus-related Pol polyprotein from transposon TNT 1-94 [Tanacetum cinerariifolium]